MTDRFKKVTKKAMWDNSMLTYILNFYLQIIKWDKCFYSCFLIVIFVLKMHDVYVDEGSYSSWGHLEVESWNIDLKSFFFQVASSVWEVLGSSPTYSISSRWVTHIPAVEWLIKRNIEGKLGGGAVFLQYLFPPLENCWVWPYWSFWLLLD